MVERSHPKNHFMVVKKNTIAFGSFNVLESHEIPVNPDFGLTPIHSLTVHSYFLSNFMSGLSLIFHRYIITTKSYQIQIRELPHFCWLLSGNLTYCSELEAMKKT